MAELEHFSQSPDPTTVKEAVRAIGRCAQSSSPSTSARCLRLLLRQIHAADQALVAEALEVIRHLIQQAPDRHAKTVVRLAKNLDTLRSDKARASVIWLVGEFAGLTSLLRDSVAPDVLRILLRDYADEGPEVRAQIVLLAAKVYLIWLNERKTSRSGDADDADGAGRVEDGDETITRLWQHSLLLARYTPDYDLRDRARLFRALLAVPSSTDLASLLLLAPKPVPQAPSPSAVRAGLALGSATLVVGPAAGVAGVKGYEDLPAWVREGEEPDARLREEDGRAVQAVGARREPASRALDEAVRKTPAGKKSLDRWLESSGEEETEDEEGSEEESEEEVEEDEDDEETESEEASEEESSEDEGRGLVKR